MANTRRQSKTDVAITSRTLNYFSYLDYYVFEIIYLLRNFSQCIQVCIRKRNQEQGFYTFHGDRVCQGTRLNLLKRNIQKYLTLLRPNSDLSQTSHCNIKCLSVSEVMRIENMITQVKFY